MTLVRRTAALLLAVLTTAAVAAAGAHAADPPGAHPCGPPTDPPAALNATSNRTGVIDLMFNDTPRPAVSFYECLADGRVVRLGERVSPDGGITVLGGAATWLCGRRDRSFAAETTLPDGTLSRGRSTLRTPSCDGRFAVTVARQAIAGRRLTVRLADRWLTGGVTTRLCLIDPEARRRCDRVAFPAGRPPVAVRRFTPTVRGRWTVDLELAGTHVTRPVTVGTTALVAAARPVVLATGDSTIHNVDSSLVHELRGKARVVGDMHPGFAMSLANSWLPIARFQVGENRPRAVVVSLGAAEGFPMKGTDGVTHTCCGPAWIAEYARRVREVMAIYRRAGRAHVFYATIAAVRAPPRQRIVAAVNQAILDAAQDAQDVTVFRADTFFSPDGYQETLEYRGRTVAIRKSDGVHLNAAGAAIEAREIGRLVSAYLAGRQIPPSRR